MVTRSEGYRRSAGKEPLATACIQEFFRVIVGVPLDLIADADENYRLGDLRSPVGINMECKGQPIDPLKYRQNFVEVFEETHRLDQSNGFIEVARLLGVIPRRLAELDVTLRDGSRTVLDWVPYVSVSILSIFNSPLTTYVNYRDGGKWIYVYDRSELTTHIKTAVPKGLLRGAGDSNEDTFAVKIPIAKKCWQRVPSGYWQWAGEGDGDAAVAHLKGVLTGEIAAL